MIDVALSRQLAHALNVPAFFALPRDEQERIRALFQHDDLAGVLSDAGKQALTRLSAEKGGTNQPAV